MAAFWSDVMQDVIVTDPVDLGPTGGAVWSHHDECQRRRTPAGCVICTSGAPLDIIAELPSVWVVAPGQAPLPGYVCVVGRVHVNEPFELPPEQQARFWTDAMLVAEAVGVGGVTDQDELRGAWQHAPASPSALVPARHADDPFVGGPIDPRKALVTRTPAQLEALAAAIQQRLAR
jgi:hypothetical protein